MKNKILSMMVIAVLIAAFSCGSKSTNKDQEASGVDTTTVKSDTTSTSELPQDSLQAN
jgi:predicted small lipoprotein YifL